MLFVVSVTTGKSLTKKFCEQMSWQNNQLNLLINSKTTTPKASNTKV